MLNILRLTGRQITIIMSRTDLFGEKDFLMSNSICQVIITAERMQTFVNYF